MKKKKRAIPKRQPCPWTGGRAFAGKHGGSTRAALTYYSENYVAGVEMSSIGLTLLENGTKVGGSAIMTKRRMDGEQRRSADGSYGPGNQWKTGAGKAL